MKKQPKQTEKQQPTELSAEALKTVSGGRWGVNRPPRGGKRPG